MLEVPLPDIHSAGVLFPIIAERFKGGPGCRKRYSPIDLLEILSEFLIDFIRNISDGVSDQMDDTPLYDDSLEIWLWHPLQVRTRRPSR